MTQKSDLIDDDQQFLGAKYKSGHEIHTYDDGYGPLWISRNSIGIDGIVRAQTFEDAYSICEDEFFPEADETVEELVKEYGFRREHRKVIKSDVSIPESERPPQLGAFEKFDDLSDYTDNGKLPEGLFIRWETIETPDPDAWSENELFQESFGFRPSGPNSRDVLNHGIYSKDLNGDYLEPLTQELIDEIGIVLEIKKPVEDFLLGGPGHDGYAYQSELWCVDCGQDIIRELYDNDYESLESEDTSDSPQPIFFGESDCAEHCSGCGEYLYGPEETDEDEESEEEE